jgi:hypothetical protein
MQDNLDKYTVYVKLTVVGESIEDALDYALQAVDASDLLDQDGVVGIEVDEDLDNIELIEETGYGTEDADDEY